MSQEFKSAQVADDNNFCDGYMRKPHRVDECYEGVNLVEVGDLHLCPDCHSQYAYDKYSFDEQWDDDDDD